MFHTDWRCRQRFAASILSDPEKVTKELLIDLAGRAGGELREWPLPVPNIEMGEYGSVSKDGKSATRLRVVTACPRVGLANPPRG